MFCKQLKVSLKMALEGKYCEVFTRADLESILEEASVGPADLDTVVARMREAGHQFQVDPAMPTFLLLGKDDRALVTNQFYRVESERVGSPPDHIIAIEAAYDRIRDWQYSGGVKVPD